MLVARRVRLHEYFVTYALTIFVQVRAAALGLDGTVVSRAGPRPPGLPLRRTRSQEHDEAAGAGVSMQPAEDRSGIECMQYVWS